MKPSMICEAKGTESDVGVRVLASEGAEEDRRQDREISIAEEEVALRGKSVSTSSTDFLTAKGGGGHGQQKRKDEASEMHEFRTCKPPVTGQS